MIFQTCTRTLLQFGLLPPGPLIALPLSYTLSLPFFFLFFFGCETKSKKEKNRENEGKRKRREDRSVLNFIPPLNFIHKYIYICVCVCF